jgi:hypothetical protein
LVGHSGPSLLSKSAFRRIGESHPMSRVLIRVIFLSLCVFILNVTIASASPVAQTQSSAARISGVQLGAGATPEHKIIGEANSFNSDTPEIVAVGFVEGGQTGSILKGVWVAEDSGDAAPPNQQIAQTDLKLSGGREPFTVSLSKPNKGWPVGTYRVELYIDGTLAKALPFAVTGAASSETAVQSPQSGNSILGVWSGEMGQVEFRNDGTLIYNDQTYKYSVQGDTMLLGYGGGSISVPYGITGDTLTAVVQGSRMTFTRVRSNQTASDAGAGEASHPMELVGKWCYMSNVNANDGGRMSNRCFTLYENGTYEYHAETSSSGQSGALASQGSDSGNWSASGNTITSNSRTTGTKTYTLEKRNHPKTGDPMLLLDGDAFVTATQRPSW